MFIRMINVWIDSRYNNYISKQEVFKYLTISPFYHLLYNNNVHVYLTDSNVVDEICPPERRKFLDVETIKKQELPLFRFHEETREEYKKEYLKKTIDEFWKKLKEYEKRYPVLGCYCNCITDDLIYELSHKIPLVKKPSIFIAVDRCLNVARNLNSTGLIISTTTSSQQNVINIAKSIIKSALIHETFHAFTDLNGKHYRNESWFKLIEESLANAVAYGFINKRDKIIFEEISSKQPLEYQAYKYWWNRLKHKSELMTTCHIWLRDNLYGVPFMIYPLIFFFIPAILPIEGYRRLLIEILHEMSIRYGFHEFFHKVIGPMIIYGKISNIDIMWKLFGMVMIYYLKKEL